MYISIDPGPLHILFVPLFARLGVIVAMKDDDDDGDDDDDEK